MFVGFIGSPRSGKTTVAARVFAELKSSGQPNVEFIAEHARYYIAKKLYLLQDGAKVTLTDEDQLEILTAQYEYETRMENAAGEDGIVICDSLALNALFYMSEDYRQKVYGSALWQKSISQWYKDQLLFVCQPIQSMFAKDNLRIHNSAQSKLIDDKIRLVLLGSTSDQPLTQVLNDNQPRMLNGPLDLRIHAVIRSIYERLASK